VDTSATKIATRLACAASGQRPCACRPKSGVRRTRVGRVLAAFHDPDNVMHDVLNAYHWIRRQLHEAQTTDLTGRRSDNRNVKRGGDYPRPLSICPHAQLRNGRLLHRPAPRHLDGGEHERAAGWQADGIRRADRRDAKRLTYRSR
jgi:hypothetical protein